MIHMSSLGRTSLICLSGLAGLFSIATLRYLGRTYGRTVHRTKRSASSDASTLPYDLLLFDVEGTTTPISFVKEILFPYVTRRLPAYLDQHWNDHRTQEDIRALTELSEADQENGIVNVPVIPREGDKQTVIDAVVANVAWQMSSDRKSTALKQLQGHMWSEGYATGELKGQLFGGASGDVAHWMKRWHSEHKVPLGIYSSGSVEAQKLLFRHSEAGDLTPLLSGHWDTTVGMKQDANSYRKIADQVKLPGHRILFLTDIFGEAVAASAAGMDTILLVRPGNYALPTPEEQPTINSFPRARDFHEVHQFIQQQAARTDRPQSAFNSSTHSSHSVDTSSGAFNTF